MRTYLQAKAMAKSLRESLAARSVFISHGECLDIVARQFGFGNWNILAVKIEIETAERAPPTASADVELHQLLPVLHVASREAARAFYIGVLGFEFDWGDEEPIGGRAFYSQVSHSELQMHLTTESRGDDRDRASVYFRITGIDALYRQLTANLGSAPGLAIHDTNYDARELEIQDPFGNVLRFVENNPPGMSGPK